MLKDYLKNNILITDGAMGTYYYTLTGNKSSMSEWDNINNPEIIKKIHEQYIEAGAKLIRTNTFSVNSKVMDLKKEQIKKLIKKGYDIAVEASKGKDIFIAADIGPIPEIDDTNENPLFESELDEYKYIVEAFIECGAEIFLFETLSHTKYLKEISEYIKKRNNRAFVLAQFAVDSTGYSRKGIKASRIFSDIQSINTIDAYGLNCSIGPAHLYKIMSELSFDKEDIISALPNAGYPYVENERTIYPGNPDYFAERMRDIKNLGVTIIGGCCGTTPVHIKKINQYLKDNNNEKQKQIMHKKGQTVKREKTENEFYNKVKQGKKVVLVELDPPYGTDIDKIMKAANILKTAKVDLITIADSPLGKARVDSAVAAAKILRQTGIETMPHICCRDKNIIGLKANLLGAHIEGIRNILAVTGDPVSSADRGEVKGVFNLNSVKLMQLISEMNKETFEQAPIRIGGALDLNVKNKEAQIRRMHKKIESGAKFFLTQPIYEDKVIEYLSNIKDKYDLKIFGGIMPLVSYRNAQYLNNEVPGINISEKYIKKFKKDMTREEAEEIGIEIALKIAKKLSPYVDGFYFIAPFNRAMMIKKIINNL